MNRTLAIFDFDGTLTVKDSMVDFLKQLTGLRWFYINLLLVSPMLVIYKLGLISNSKAKEYLFQLFFGGMELRKFQHACDTYSRKRIPEILRPEAISKLRFHQDNNHEIVVISASPENWLRNWCADMKISLIATKLEVQQEQVTGKLSGKNCFGPEKVNRLKKEYDLRKFNEIFVYGDSRGDREVLSLATKPFYQKFE